MAVRHWYNWQLNYCAIVITADKNKEKPPETAKAG